MPGVASVCNGESHLANELREGFSRGVMIELLPESIEEVNWKDR